MLLVRLYGGLLDEPMEMTCSEYRNCSGSEYSEGEGYSSHVPPRITRAPARTVRPCQSWLGCEPSFTRAAPGAQRIQPQRADWSQARVPSRRASRLSCPVAWRAPAGVFLRWRRRWLLA